MDQSSSNLKPSKPEKTEILDWLAAFLSGIGIWLLYGGIKPIPPVLAWRSVIFIFVGLFRFVLKGYQTVIHGKNPIAGFIYPVTWAVATASVLILTEHFLHYLVFPYPLDDGEGFCLNQAVRIAQGESLYPAIGTAPYIVTNYPPVFPWILSVFTDPGNVSFAAGRLISVISTAIIALSVGGTVNRITGNRHAGWISGILVLSSPVIYFWGALLRVDILASMFGIAAIWLAVTFRGRALLFSIPLLAAAIFTRQSSVEALFAIGLSLLLYRDENPETARRQTINGVMVIAGWAICTAIIFSVMQGISGGEFWRHTVTYTKTQFYPERILTAVKWIFPSHALILILALLGLPRALADSKRRIIGLYFIASFATGMLSGKVGSDLNYFINLIIASSCLAGIFISDLVQPLIDGQKNRGWVLAVLILIPAAIIQSGMMEGNREKSFKPFPEDYLSGRMIVEKLSSVNGPILSEDEGFCLLSGHEVLFNPFIMSEMAREGFWNETPFVQAIENREFDLIMLRFDVNNPYNDDQPGAGGHAGWDRFTPRMEAAIGENYEVDMSFSQFPDIYVPVFMRRYWYVYKPINENADVESVFGETGDPESDGARLIF